MSQIKPPSILMPTNLNDFNLRHKNSENLLQKTLHKYKNSENHPPFEAFNLGELNHRSKTRRTYSWAKPTQDKKKFFPDNEISDEETDCGNSSHVKYTRNSFNSSKDLQNLNKVYNSTNNLAEEFRNMIKKDREQFLNDYNRIENTLITLMEVLKT